MKSPQKRIEPLHSWRILSSASNSSWNSRTGIYGRKQHETIFSPSTTTATCVRSHVIRSSRARRSLKPVTHITALCVPPYAQPPGSHKGSATATTSIHCSAVVARIICWTSRQWLTFTYSTFSRLNVLVFAQVPSYRGRIVATLLCPRRASGSFLSAHRKHRVGALHSAIIWPLVLQRRHVSFPSRDSVQP